MAKKMKYIPNVDVMTFDPITKTMKAERVIEVYGDKVETETAMFNTGDADRYFDEGSGVTSYVFHIDLPAKVEAASLKNLRRSVALTRIFDYDIKKPMDLFKFMPYLIIIAMVVFK